VTETISFELCIASNFDTNAVQHVKYITARELKVFHGSRRRELDLRIYGGWISQIQEILRSEED